MATILTLTNGAATSSANSAKTTTEIANFARLVTLDKAAPPPAGLTAAQLNQYYVDALKDETVRYWKQEAAKNRLKELREAAALEATAANDTAL